MHLSVSFFFLLFIMIHMFSFTVTYTRKMRVGVRCFLGWLGKLLLHLGLGPKMMRLSYFGEGARGCIGLGGRVMGSERGELRSVYHKR